MTDDAARGPDGAGWAEARSSTHRDHVVAHVVGATVLGHFTHTDALHLLLDIGFFWIVYLDAEMGLVTEGLAISELDAEPEFRARVAADADRLRSEGVGAEGLGVLKAAPEGCVVEEVSIFERGARRMLIVRGGASGLRVETTMEEREITVEAC